MIINPTIIYNNDNYEDYVPAEKEIIIYSDISYFKIGDGITSLKNLEAYATSNEEIGEFLADPNKMIYEAKYSDTEIEQPSAECKRIYKEVNPKPTEAEYEADPLHFYIYDNEKYIQCTKAMPYNSGKTYYNALISLIFTFPRPKVAVPSIDDNYAISWTLQNWEAPQNKTLKSIKDITPPEIIDEKSGAENIYTINYTTNDFSTFGVFNGQKGETGTIGVFSFGQEGLVKAQEGEEMGKFSLVPAIANIDYLTGHNPTGTGSFSLNRKEDSTVGDFSFAEGIGTTASGNASHAAGIGTVATANYSYAEGISAKASSMCQHVQGKYNVEDNGDVYADIIGNGTENLPANIEATSWEGNKYLAGDVYVHCNEDSTGGSKLPIIEYSNVDIGVGAELPTGTFYFVYEG